MVQRSSVLLSRCSLVICLGVACSPERLRIHVPPTGVDSVNQEDLRRAYWALERGAEPSQWWLQRAEQFHLHRSTFTCHYHQGWSTEKAVVYAQSTPMQLTVMASLAKALDRTEPPWSWYFCLVGDVSNPETKFQTVIDLTETLRESAPFVEVNFEQLAHDVQSIIREEMTQE